MRSFCGSDVIVITANIIFVEQGFVLRRAR